MELGVIFWRFIALVVRAASSMTPQPRLAGRSALHVRVGISMMLTAAYTPHSTISLRVFSSFL